ncbi:MULTISPECIES: PadR family transcriptional regulator [Prauserella salsuginis group]|uniref:DNA-binding PadR family transcriptional regulator n=2 Tax=Prauserella salsuginis group TaxID=2893672 RepID=A0A839XRT7_9PSEU|nr:MULTISPECIES: PadR family transcriptional regulator [Prauserella salsuginis group]MBB3663668.1 DNA-binding PadR family transcriptional regulator [Prauserella sediminis]MCR3722551.1 DNA-binding transcriptional regulator, PadR family [Prauserella flava]MCR3736993.1 DNA-binding transcriptional regulator, PadR family [Prauserella salsuginis]
MSATRLLVLGVVRMHGGSGGAHGYQVRRELLSWSADKWANVQPGSIYHALKKLALEGLLEQVETPQGKGPDRLAYTLTDAGEHAFQQELQQRIADVADDAANASGFAAALVFLTCLPRQLALDLLDYRLVQLDGQRKNVATVLEKGTDWGQPAHVNELYRLWLAHCDADISWTTDLVARLRAGEYVMADDAGQNFGSATPSATS